MQKKLIILALAIALLAGCEKKTSHGLKTAESNGYSYEYVPDDPLNVRIYTLKNGLKVYLSKYDTEPRISTQIAVKAGGRNDPSDNTGLAHYLEHIMFKGTHDFGTMDWTKESVYLDSVEHMFTHYGTLTDSIQRAGYYKLIDRVSSEASKLAIPNEYDKMVGELGAQGTNAYTSEDRTVYVNDIPANQLDNWLEIEANRFETITPRLFHTELEAVYEEKNRSLDNDYWKTYEAMAHAIYPTHQYGTQTVIGTIEHLKNPSITEIKNYFEKYYRPNNVAICLSGDLDFDKTIAMIDKHFGKWEANPNLPGWSKTEEAPIAAHIPVDVYGPDAEWINLGFRFNGRNSRDYQLLKLCDMILANSQAGLIDINLKQKQKVLEPSCYVNENNDYVIHTFTGRPREGQSLDDVRKLLLEQIELLKKGEFEDWLIEATINDLKKSRIQQSEQNWSRSNDLVMAFTNDIPWNVYTSEIDDLRTITKEDIVNFAANNYKDNYVVIYKRTGKDSKEKKVTKPTITKVTLNKENKSPFHEKILAKPVDKLKPVFVDYKNEIAKSKTKKNIDVLYTPNTENDLFTLYYLSDFGSNNDPKIKVAVEYLEYLGTTEMSADEFKKEFYKLGCNFGVYASEDQTYISLTGLTENMEKSLELFEKLLSDPKADDEALKKMIDGTFKKRDDQKKDKGAIMFSGLLNYGLYGPKSPFTNVLSNKELRDVKAEELITILKDFTKTEHRVMYYGPAKIEELVATLDKYHVVPDQLKPVPTPVEFNMMDSEKSSVYWADYDMVQEEILFLNRGDTFDKNRVPIARLFNEYFGGTMSSPVFQELREAQGLAYAAFAFYANGSKPTEKDAFYAYIGTQADKQPEAMKAMNQLLQDFPKSENGLEVAKNAIINQIESQRITKTDILFSFEQARKQGIDYDIRKDIYEQMGSFTLDDLTRFQQTYIKGQKSNIVLIGDKARINFKELQPYGKVQELTLDEIFGYEKVQKIDVEGPKQ